MDICKGQDGPLTSMWKAHRGSHAELAPRPCNADCRSWAPEHRGCWSVTAVFSVTSVWKKDEHTSLHSCLEHFLLHVSNVLIPAPEAATTHLNSHFFPAVYFLPVVRVQK